MKTLDIYKLRVLTALITAGVKLNPGQVSIAVGPSEKDYIGLGAIGCARELNELHAMGLVSRVSGCCNRFDYLPTPRAAQIVSEHATESIKVCRDVIQLLESRKEPA